jgi:hypothetical protein
MHMDAMQPTRLTQSYREGWVAEACIQREEFTTVNEKVIEGVIKG